ncbi:MAG: hypothetical protein GF311_10390 [Candidatus Lokiarchaeota archaeon]|nr:hypothetical protein [Candidatus Lokiarchaeota archaeon]
MGEIGLESNQLQKCLLFLALQKKEKKSGLFQDIKTYLNPAYYDPLLDLYQIVR